MKKRRWWLWLIGGIAVAAVTLGVGQVVAGPKQTDRALVVKVGRADLEVSVMETGKVEPREKVDIKSKVPGQVAKVLVHESEPVKAGQPLLQIDPTDFEREVALRRADVAKAAADLAATRNALAFANLNLERRQRGLENRGVAQADVDVAASEARAKRAAVATAQAALDGARVTLEVARDRLRYTRVVSPMNGVVIQCGIKAGEVVVPGVQATFDDKALLAIADLSTLVVKINLNQIDVAKVTLGQAVTLTLDALPTHTYHAKISEIAASSVLLKDKQMEVFPVEATLTDADQLIKPGMTADVRIHVQLHPHVLSLPIEAVIKDHGKSFVNKVSYVDKTMKTTLVEVSVGAHNDRDVAIESGVQEGEEVLIKPGSSAANEYNL